LLKFNHFNTFSEGNGKKGESKTAKFAIICTHW